MLESKLDFNLLRMCDTCGACYNVCPCSLHIEGYDPRAVIRDILAGDYEHHLDTPHIWQCLECHACLEICYQHYGFENAMTAMRALATKKGKNPPQIKRGWDMFAKTGCLGDPSPQRKRLGLPEAAATGKDEFLKLHALYKEGRGK